MKSVRRWQSGIALIWFLNSPAFAQSELSLDSLTSLARSAYVIAYPTLESYRTMFQAVGSTPGGRFNQFTHALRLADATSRWVVRPNNDTFYGGAWLDLRGGGAILLTIPAAPATRYRSAQVVDQFTHNVAILSEPSNEARRYLVAGPSWSGALPRNLTGTIRLETGFAFVLVRTAVYGPPDSAAAAQVQQAFTVEQVLAPSGRLDTLTVYDRAKATSADFVSYFNNVLRFSKLPDQKALGAFAPIGVRADGEEARVALTAEQRRAVDRGVTEGLARVRAGGLTLRSMKGTWGSVDSAFGNRERMDGRPVTRAAAAMYGLFGLDREEAVYLSATVDSVGQPLNGASRTYVLRFRPDELPPATAFWSITVYDSAGFLTANPINRYSIGDRTPGVTRDPDGGLTIQLRATRPAESDATNWLPIPAGGFSLTMRVYRPDQTRMRHYTPPAIRRKE